jgi:hypothetical protein
MRDQLPDTIELYRAVTGEFATPPDNGPTGFYYPVPCLVTRAHGMRIVANDASHPVAEGWEHVSVSFKDRTPTWEEMCWVKEQFWEDEETVFQLHPPASQHINNHPHCLHLWRNIKLPFHTPPGIMVGVKEVGVIKNAQEAAAVRRKYLK